jgi:hypothetical protein
MKQRYIKIFATEDIFYNIGGCIYGLECIYLPMVSNGDKLKKIWFFENKYVKEKIEKIEFLR